MDDLKGFPFYMYVYIVHSYMIIEETYFLKNMSITKSNPVIISKD